MTNRFEFEQKFFCNQYDDLVNILNKLDFKKENDSLKFVPASVIGMDIPGFFKNFTVDKGYNAGISKDDVVITENGVIGCVYKVGAVCSKVRSILSPDIKIVENNLKVKKM